MTQPTDPATTDSVNRPLRLLQVGAGSMGRGWLRNINAYEEVELVGVADLDVATAKSALDDLGLSQLPVAETLQELAGGVAADAVVDVTIPEAHHAVTLEALDRGLPVLGEKPLAATLAEALEMIAAAEAKGLLFMVSQNRRYDPNLFAYRRMIREVGTLGVLAASFYKAPHFGGFRDAMDHPLLLDMSIHTFDSTRFLTGAEPVAVYCEEYNPAWSWYSGDAATTAIFEMSDGSRFVYSGSWCSEGLETSWNSSWRASGARGTALWDGDGLPTVEVVDDREAVPQGDTEADPHPGIAGSLRDFVQAVRTGSRPMGEARDNLLSLAMVHAAIASAATKQRVQVTDVLERAHQEALARATGSVRDALSSWTTLTPPG